MKISDQFAQNGWWHTALELEGLAQFIEKCGPLLFSNAPQIVLLLFGKLALMA